jgi:hypothetical protein
MARVPAWSASDRDRDGDLRGARRPPPRLARALGIETDATRRLAADRDLRLCGWNLDTHDWRGDESARMLGALDAQGGLSEGLDLHRCSLRLISIS